MTWEITTFLSVFMICFTAILCWPVTEIFFAQNQVSDVSQDELERLNKAVDALVLEHEAVHKLAEETKKLLSQQNLGLSLRGPR
jgi:hypothetical protein